MLREYEIKNYEITKYFENQNPIKQLESIKGTVKKNDEFNKLKTYNHKIYTGMKIGGEHYWNYNNGRWYEKKKAPNKWKITFNCIKERTHSAPQNTGAQVGTKYHWFIIADQIAEKLNANSYMTTMRGTKYKIGHKRPHWKQFSYDYCEQKNYKEQLIQILEDTLARLKSER
ncbi:MAG: hypothetical protein BAJALOKI1v1_570018 [Promethearchaeota archaeon]|nr:MAG: hypothetical protein BAJALOKI1v1_570018 [Candidatus Lokiarchaeota archaeon]